MNIFQPNGTHFIILVLVFLGNTFQFISDPFLNGFTTTLEECLVLFCLISAIEYTASDLQLAPSQFWREQSFLVCERQVIHSSSDNFG